jgi:hypothetical protein
MRWYKVKNINVSSNRSELSDELNGYTFWTTITKPDLQYSIVIAPDNENIPISNNITELTEAEVKTLGETWQLERSITYPDGSQEIIPKLDIVEKFKNWSF